MAAAQQLLQERGFTFEPMESEKNETRLLSSWDTPSTGVSRNGKLTRYLMVGLQVAPKQSVVRIFRLSRAMVGNDVEIATLNDKMKLEAQEQNADPIRNKGLSFQTERVAETRGVMNGIRATDLENELTLRLESGASIELVAGNIKSEDKKPARRGEDFYLQRWKQQPEGNAPVASARCGTEVRGLRKLLRPGQTLLIGEQLGSEQLPAIVGDMVCQAAESGHIVTLGLSIPRLEQERLDRYLTSAGGPADQDELLDGDFWRRPYQDGRSSRAVMDLIDRVRALRASGLIIHLVAYDTDLLKGNERDAAFADVWMKRRAARPEEVFIVVSGNAHVNVSRGSQWDSGYEPMGWHMLKADPTLKALDMSFAQGTRWACDLNAESNLDCRVYGSTPSQLVAKVKGLSPHIELFEGGVSLEGYHGLLYVGELSASPPATAPNAIPVRSQDTTPSSPTAPPRPPARLNR
ncbi:hypothetical protein DAT35_39825 [Vitiosangium sp. GDMCC 1.1324]|nr:hypothetical protein DAT35_39825 [Vitiosangium sp. GDMCC 1.1324]